MTWPTHRQYSITFAFLANIILYAYGVTEINYYLALPIMLLVSKYGALFPDVDHSWKNVKEKTVPNLIINKLIHLTGGKHRSWQTHSIDIVAIVTIFSCIFPNWLYETNRISMVNKEVMSIILIGFSAGWISHMLSDMMTSAGVKLICFLKFKVALVPKRLFSLRFKTGEGWEEFCFRVTRVVNIILGTFSLIYPLLMDGTLMRWVNQILSMI